jgi:pyruvate formate lyase activating enzyme
MTRCPLCPHHCALGEGSVGRCRARGGEGGKDCLNAGLVSAIALDPVEKKPLARFRPGRMVLSVGSFGCNLRCPFCQNHEIAMAAPAGGQKTAPAELASLAESLTPRGNIGLAYTYNEPLVGFEFVRDCAREIRARGMQNILVTNGCFCLAPLEELIPMIDAANVDLKGFTQDYYDWVGGDLETVKAFIARLSQSCHVEVTTLVVPGRNDAPEEIGRLAAWLSGLGDIPLHLSRCFPRHRYAGAPTPASTLYALRDAAHRHLSHVYLGNL